MSPTTRTLHHPTRTSRTRTRRSCRRRVSTNNTIRIRQTPRTRSRSPRLRARRISFSSRIKDLDTGVITGHIRPLIVQAWVVVFDFHTFDIHGEWCVIEIGETACPCYCAFRLFTRSGCPYAERDFAGCLWKVLPADGIGVGKCSNSGAVNEPCYGRGCPVYAVCVEIVIRSCDRVVDRAIVACGVAFAEIVSFNAGVVAT